MLPGHKVEKDGLVEICVQDNAGPLRVCKAHELRIRVPGHGRDLRPIVAEGRKEAMHTKDYESLQTDSITSRLNELLNLLLPILRGEGKAKHFLARASTNRLAPLRI